MRGVAQKNDAEIFCENSCGGFKKDAAWVCLQLTCEAGVGQREVSKVRELADRLRESSY